MRGFILFLYLSSVCTTRKGIVQNASKMLSSSLLSLKKRKEMKGLPVIIQEFSKSENAK